MSVQPLRTGGDIDEVINKYKNMVYAIAMTRVKNRDDADDVFQEVFLVYWRKQPSFNSEEHRKAWLISTAVNCSKKLASSPWRHTTVPLEQAQGQAFEFTSPEDTELYSALCSLKLKYRTALHLFYFEDMSVEQISRTLGIREGTVRMQLTRGRELLREKLKGEAYNG